MVTNTRAVVLDTEKLIGKVEEHKIATEQYETKQEFELK